MCIHVKYSSGEISITCTLTAHGFVLYLSFIKKTAYYAFSAWWAVRTLFYFMCLRFCLKSTLIGCCGAYYIQTLLSSEL